MTLKMNRILSSGFAQWLVYKFIRIYSLTYRFEVQNEEIWLNNYLNSGEKILLCVHHQQFLPAIRYFQKYKQYKPGLMISQSRDGELISAIANLSGWTTVRGSSSRGGTEALRGMINHLAEHRLASHIIDGPRGPFGVVKPGAIRLAVAAESVIVPFYCGANSAWYARSWDRFLIPKPFSKVILRFGKKIEIDHTQSFDEQKLMLQERMREENEQLQKELGQE